VRKAYRRTIGPDSDHHDADDEESERDHVRDVALVGQGVTPRRLSREEHVVALVELTDVGTAVVIGSTASRWIDINDGVISISHGSTV